MKNKFEYIAFLIFSCIFRIMGLNNARRFSSFLAVIFFYFIPIRKKVVIENLHIAFPDNDAISNKKLAFRIYKSFAITLVEIMSLNFISKSQMIKIVKCKNPELIVQKFEEGKGVILLSSHFGNWEFIAISVAIQIQLPFSVIVKPLRNPLVYEFMNRGRTKFGNEVVPLGISVRKTYQTLKEKKIVAMAADQRGPQEGVKVKFFNKDVSVYTGPAVLSLKTGAPIISGLAIRNNDFTYDLELTEISMENLPEDEDEKIMEICQRYTLNLENVIREHPEQWLWMHKRWKY